MKALLEEIACIAADAARLVAKLRSEGLGFTYKPDGSPVTLADERAEELILERLAKAYPSLPVVAEELTASGVLTDVGSGPFLLVDPLDGTKEFIKGKPDYTVNIALVEGGVPVAGVVVAPERRHVFAGCCGKAWRGGLGTASGPPGDRCPISVRRPGSVWTAVVSVSHMTEETRAFLQRVPAGESASVGSSLKFCLLAEGLADIYPRFGRTMQWDTAAGDAVLRAAGGVTLTTNLEPLGYGPRIEPGASPFENPYFIAFGGGAAQLAEVLQSPKAGSWPDAPGRRSNGF